LISRSVCCKSSEALPRKARQRGGMYSRSPSSSGGMNSPPTARGPERRREDRNRATKTVSDGPARFEQRAVERDKEAIERILFLGRNAPADEITISTGMSVTASPAAAPSHRSW